MSTNTSDGTDDSSETQELHESLFDHSDVVRMRAKLTRQWLASQKELIKYDLFSDTDDTSPEDQKKIRRKVHMQTTPPTPSDSEVDRYVNPSKVAKSDKGRKHTSNASKVLKTTKESYKNSAPSEVAKSDMGHSRGHPTPKRPTGDTGSHVSRSHSTRHPSKVAEVEQAATLDTKMHGDYVTAKSITTGQTI